MSAHTQGLLETFVGEGFTAVLPALRDDESFHSSANGGDDIAQCYGPDQEANARRIAACWNACEHITTESVEAYCEAVSSVISAAGAAHIAMTAQRDELLAALKAVIREDAEGQMGDGLSVGVVAQATSAIRKTIGEPS